MSVGKAGSAVAATCELQEVFFVVGVVDAAEIRHERILDVAAGAGLVAGRRIEGGDVFVADCQRIEFRFALVVLLEIVIRDAGNGPDGVLADCLVVIERLLHKQFVVKGGFVLDMGCVIALAHGPVAFLADQVGLAKVVLVRDVEFGVQDARYNVNLAVDVAIEISLGVDPVRKFILCQRVEGVGIGPVGVAVAVSSGMGFVIHRHRRRHGDELGPRIAVEVVGSGICEEEVFAELNGLKEMVSSSKESESNIMMLFHHNIDTDFIVIDIREKIAMIKHTLPKETEKPIIAKFEQSDSPIIILSLSSLEKTPEQLREIAEEQLKERIMRVSGVANVEFGGGRERKFLIEMDNSKLLGYKLSILEVVQKINLANLSISAGEINQNSKDFVIRATGEYNSIEEIENTAIAITQSGSIVRIGDIATIRDSYYEPTSYSRLNVQDVVSVYIQKESTANTIKVANEAIAIIDKMQTVLDPDITITIVKNDAEYIQKAISSLVEALVLGGIILAGVLFLFMKNVRSIFIVATTMPLSLFMSIILMYFTNQTFNIMTLSGLAMGMANVMDNSIVVLENIAFHYHRKTFATKAELVVKGTAELWQPIFASTVTTIIVFLPLVFLEPEIRQMYVPFGLTITFALVASVIATMMFIPTEIYRWQNKFDLDFQKWYIKVRHIYGKMLKFCFRWQTYVWIFTIILFLLSAKIMMTRDSEFMDAGNVNTFRIGVQFPPATRIEVSNEIVRKMEQALMSYKDQVERVSSKVEKLHTFVEVKVYEKAEEFKEEFRKRFGEFSPAFVYFQDSQSSASKEIYVDFYGQNYDTLKQLAFSASGRLQQVKDLPMLK